MTMPQLFAPQSLNGDGGRPQSWRAAFATPLDSVHLSHHRNAIVPPRHKSYHFDNQIALALSVKVSPGGAEAYVTLK